MTRTQPNALNYPPYLEALAKERLSRDAAMLGIHESIAGFEVLPLSLSHLLILRIMRHPLLMRGIPAPGQLDQFLWLVSPDFSPDNVKGKRRLFGLCRRRFHPPRYLAILNTRRARIRYRLKRFRRWLEAAKVIEACKAYLDETFQDAPPMTQARGFQPDYYSDGVAFCAQFGREFGYDPDRVMHMPLKVLFQFLNEMKAANGSRVPLCNPSDAVKAKFYVELNQQLASGRHERNQRLKELTAEMRAKRKRKI